LHFANPEIQAFSPQGLAPVMLFLALILSLLFICIWRNICLSLMLLLFR